MPFEYQEILAGTVGREKTFGSLAGKIRPTDFTYCRVATDDLGGRIRAYVGEGEITRDPLTTFPARLRKLGLLDKGDEQRMLEQADECISLTDGAKWIIGIICRMLLLIKATRPLADHRSTASCIPGITIALHPPCSNVAWDKQTL